MNTTATVGGGGGEPPALGTFTFTPPVPDAPTWIRIQQSGQREKVVNKVAVSFDWGKWGDCLLASPHTVRYRINGGANSAEVKIEPGDDVTITGAIAGDVIAIDVRTHNATGSSGYITGSITLTAMGGTRYIAPTAQGTGDGLTYANAAAESATNINAAATAVGANGKVVFCSTFGDYNGEAAPRILTVGGTTQHPVMFCGENASGIAAFANFKGIRGPSDGSEWVPPVDPETVTDADLWYFGATAIRPAASNVWFDKIRFERVGACLYCDNNGSDNDHEYVSATNIEMFNVGRGFYTGDNGINITNILIRNVNGVGSGKQVIRFRSASKWGVVRDVEFDHRRIDNDAGGFPATVAFDRDAPTDAFTILRVIGRNHHFSENNPSSYWNGDCISAERTNTGIKIIQCEGYGSTDGGFDLKAPDAFLYSCKAGDNKRNYRPWGDQGDIDFWRCESITPRKRGGSGGVAHFFMTNFADVWLYQCKIKSTTEASLFVTEDDANACTGRWTELVVDTPSGVPNITMPANGMYFPDVDPTGATLGAAPAFTMSLTHSIQENTSLTLPVTISGNEGNDVLIRVFPSTNRDAAFSFSGGAVTQTGPSAWTQAAITLGLTNPDFEAPTDTKNVPGDNVYEIALRCRDAARRGQEATVTCSVTNQVSEDLGTVGRGATVYGRWNITDKNSQITLSGSERKTATHTGASPIHACVRLTEPFWAPLHIKGYYEAEFSAIGDDLGVGIGFANASHPIHADAGAIVNVAVGKQLGSGWHGVSWLPDGRVLCGNTVLAMVAGYTSGDRLRICVRENHYDNFPAQRPTFRYLYLAVNNGPWNSDPVVDPNALNSAGGIQFGDDGVGNPAAYSTTLAYTGPIHQGVVDPLFPCANLYNPSDAVTIYTAPTEWDYSPPTGYAAWGGRQKVVYTGNGRVRFIGPTVAGNGSGDSFANRMAITSLNTAIGYVGPGGYVLLDGSIADYTFGSAVTGTITITKGGDVGNPVTVIGIDPLDNSVHPVRMRGGRAGTNGWLLPENPETGTATSVSPWTTPSSGVGIEFIRLGLGANHITFERMDWWRWGTPLALYQNNAGITIQDCQWYNNQRPTNITSRTPNDATGLRYYRNILTGHSKPALHIRQNSSDILVEYMRTNCGRQTRDGFPVGVQIEDTVFNATIRYQYTSNQWEASDATAYKQGDGNSSESSNKNITYEHIVAFGCGDGGIDTKAKGLVIDTFYSWDNKRGHRAWNGIGDTAGNTVALPGPINFVNNAHFWRHILRGGDQGSDSPMWGIVGCQDDANSNPPTSQTEGAAQRRSDIVYTNIRTYTYGGCINQQGASAVGRGGVMRIIDGATVLDDGSLVHWADDPTAFTFGALDEAQESLGWRALFAHSYDTTVPNITSPTTVTVAAGYPLSTSTIGKAYEIPLRADVPVVWYRTGGDLADVYIRNPHRSDKSIIHPTAGYTTAFPSIGSDYSKTLGVKCYNAVGNTAVATITILVKEVYTPEDADALAAYNRFLADGVVHNNIWAFRLQNQVISLKAAGLWDKIDVWHDYRLGIRNIRADARHAVLFGGAAVTFGTGIVLDAVDDYIDTNFNPSTSGVATQDSVAVTSQMSTYAAYPTGTYALSNFDGTDGIVLAHDVPHVNAGTSPTTIWRVNSAGGTNPYRRNGAMNGANAMHTITRTGSAANQCSLYRSGALAASNGGGSASVAPNNATVKLGLHQAAYQTGTHKLFVSSAGLNATEIAALYSNLFYP